MRRRHCLALGAALLSACGSAGSPTAGHTPSPAVSAIAAASPSPATSPAPHGLLFAVLETSSPHSFPGNANTVAIVGLDGYARAKQHFTPRTLPGQCDAATLPQPEARVTGGVVFYADGTGHVRSLTSSGTVADVTTFPITSQQFLSFAVDPAGTHLLGSVITVPKFTSPMPCQQQGSYVVDLETADAGGHPQNVYHQVIAQAAPDSNFVEAVGWDPAGALVTVHTNIGTQNGSLGQKWNGQLAHWTPAGIGSVVGGSDCRAQDEQGNSIACISNQQEGGGSIRAPDASVQWKLPSAIYYYILLSPDASQAAFCNTSECGVKGKDGNLVKLPSDFAATGWLDNSTLIGVKGGSNAALAGPYGELETLSLSDLTKVNDLGFNGIFVGTVQTS